MAQAKAAAEEDVCVCEAPFHMRVVVSANHGAVETLKKGVVSLAPAEATVGNMHKQLHSYLPEVAQVRT